MASASLEAWEIALNEGLSEQQQGLIFDKLKQASKPGHVVVADLWASLHRASAEKLKGAIIGRVPELEAGLRSATLQRDDGAERLWAGIKALKSKPKQVADLSSQIQSSYQSCLASGSDDEEQEDSSDHAGGQNDEDMTDALPPPTTPSPLFSCQYLELFVELRDLFNAPECLLIRSSYEILHETLMKAAEERGAKMLVTGTPGIGKTSWIIYLLWKLANAGKTVILDLDKDVFFFSSNACFKESSTGHFADSLTDPSVFYIVDNKVPQTNAVAVTLEVSSPDHEKIHEFKKYAAVYYMPIFTLNELEATREWFPDVTQDRMLELYGKWGGSTHWVLQRGGPEDSEFNAAQLREAISSTSVEMLRRAFLGDATAQASRRIIHLVPDPANLKRYELQFASQYLADKVAVTIAEAKLLELKEFLSVADPHVWGSVQGTFFESMANRQRRLGGSFSAKTFVVKCTDSADWSSVSMHAR